MSELQLDAAVARLIRDCKVALHVGAPQVAYCEALTNRTEINYTHKRRTGGAGQFAEVTIVFNPLGAGAGSSFESRIVDGSLPDEYVCAVEKGVNSVMGSGVLAGFPVVDVKATLVDGAYHDVDSSVLAFEIAARAAFREALQTGGSILFEPIMQVEVTSPEEYAAAVVGGLQARRGKIQGQATSEGVCVIKATAPLANMFGYASQLRSLTRGQATFAMEFFDYQPVPPRGDGPRPPAAAAALRA
jgi:elongation factor G